MRKENGSVETGPGEERERKKDEWLAREREMQIVRAARFGGALFGKSSVNRGEIEPIEERDTEAGASSEKTEREGRVSRKRRCLRCRGQGRRRRR